MRRARTPETRLSEGDGDGDGESGDEEEAGTGTQEPEVTRPRLTEIAEDVRTLEVCWDEHGPCLAGLGVVCQRRAQLVDANSSSDFRRPNFKGVKHFTVEVSATNIVLATLSIYAHQRAKEEHEMENLRQKATGSCNAGPDV